MFTHTWEAMGTKWHIAVLAPADQTVQSESKEREQAFHHLWQLIESETNAFEKRFSRFIPTSEANAWANTPDGGVFPVSPTMRELLTFAQEWKQKTAGKFDPAVGGLLEAAGYNAQYSFQPSSPESWHAPTWELRNDTLTVSGSLVIDVGGFGKGFWIDTLSALLTKYGFPFHLVDGGGDMYATTKPNGDGWRIALEFPGRPEEALDVVTLKNEGLAVSDTLKRQWGSWHHVLSPATKLPTKHVPYVAVRAPSALLADGLTTVLMVSEEAVWPELLQDTSAQYICVRHDQILLRSPGWRGELVDK